nr:glycosyltransferase family 39 protein [Synechococcus sp. CCY 9618]
MYQRIQQALTGLLILVFLWLAGQGLAEGYSYWSDELWSVTASRASWGVLLRDWLLPDTHPPLYQALLKLWMEVVGSGETATRALSFLMATIALVATALFASGRSPGRRLVAVAVLGTSPAFLFYAQETRSYATSLALSAVLLGAVLMLRQRAQEARALQGLAVLAGLLLSLTHYLSLLFVLVVLAVGCAEGLILRPRRQALPMLVALLLWPAGHLLTGSFSNRMERLDWIRVAPISGTLGEVLAGTLPLLAPDRGASARPLLLAAGLAVALVFALTAGRRHGARRPPALPPPPQGPFPAAGEARFLLAVIGTFLALMLVIDLVKPLSQARYYIVLLPALAYLAGDGWELSKRLGRARRAALAGLLAVALLTQQQIGLGDLALKRSPLQNYKAMAAFVERSGVCERGCWSTGWRLDTLSPLYFPPDQLRPWPGEPAAAAQPLERPFLGFHLARNDLPTLRAANPAMACWEAPGAWSSAPFILLNATTGTKPAQEGLRPCPP